MNRRLERERERERERKRERERERERERDSERGVCLEFLCSSEMALSLSLSLSLSDDGAILSMLVPIAGDYHATSTGSN